MLNKRIAALAALALVGAARAACAQLELQKAQWQLARWDNGRPKEAENISHLSLTPGVPSRARISARLTLLSRGGAVEGRLLRYSIAAKIASLENPQEAAWAVPFGIGEKKIPKIGPNRAHETQIDLSAPVRRYLNQLHRSGYWPQEIKLQVMLEPRRGETGPIQTIESSVSVKK
ncbi:MAG: hypothetical protein HY549_09750 [Elusimicrobia bacterium]|nr:hypothetical protein [Elusimicrobiota bacterium]